MQLSMVVIRMWARMSRKWDQDVGMARNQDVGMETAGRACG